MKITVIETTIEASTEELRASNSLAESFSGLLRGVFNRMTETQYEEQEEEDGPEE